MNDHLTINDFKRIFDTFSGPHMYQMWNACNRIEPLFGRCLATNEELAWMRAKAGYYRNIRVNETLTLN